jgi:hypothetical protein
MQRGLSARLPYPAHREQVATSGNRLRNHWLNHVSIAENASTRRTAPVAGQTMMLPSSTTECVTRA